MIMIMIIDYDFVSYVIFDQHLKTTFRKSSGLPPLKNSTPPPKNLKSTSPPFLLTLKIFQAPCRKGGRTLLSYIIFQRKLCNLSFF